MRAWVAITVFIATNVDDLFLLVLWFVKRSLFSTVLLGQFLGFSAILLLSLLGYWGLQLLPHSSLHWLGLAPIAIGLKHVVTSTRSAQQVQTDSAWSVAAITFANGSDNLAVYPPFFAKLSRWQVSWIVITFYLLLFLYVIAAYFAALHIKRNDQFQRWAHRIAPLIIIGIGLAIVFSP
jgi:cadmium resistance protein CadD (predicted permease)